MIDIDMNTDFFCKVYKCKMKHEICVERKMLACMDIKKVTVYKRLTLWYYYRCKTCNDNYLSCAKIPVFHLDIVHKKGKKEKKNEMLGIQKVWKGKRRAEG